jgi:rhamnose utilization protein RhaD (predicted bifunctional aldolase and dehydrogenase)/NAD(P)-dependent dehydrogenase (short-subunit alcohol dehydrogenase family)
MKDLWNEQDAAAYAGDLAQRVYSSHLLGREPALVLHGGGNTSVKLTETNILGEPEDILYVKGSGWDLESIEESGFAPVRMAHLLKLAQLERLSDPDMVNELRTHMTRAAAPSPSVETVLHAILPYKYVDHTHADAVVTVSNTANGEQRIREIYGDTVVIIPYTMPGFDLARVCAELFPRQAGPRTLGMVLLNHGIFSFGTTAREAYQRMIELVSKAEAYLQGQRAWDLPGGAVPEAQPLEPVQIAQLRGDISECAGFPVILNFTSDEQSLRFAHRDDLAAISQRGPVTPDHVIRTKRIPCLGTDISAYARAYEDYFAAHSADAPDRPVMLDPAPRVLLDKRFGMATVGRTVTDALVVRDLYRHSMDIIARAQLLGGYRALPGAAIFAVEYWDLEQAKLRKGGEPPPFRGEIALVTGAASGIGKACVEAFLARGAAVVGLDRNAGVAGLFPRDDFLGLVCDVTDETALEAALGTALGTYGGLDMLVLNAGIFPGGCRIEALSKDTWRSVMAVNLDANLSLLRLTHPLLQRAPHTGRVVVIGSKNVPAPGPGAAAYSASKAALNQLMRVAALEWGQDGIRINALHPDAVFDTGLWTDDVLTALAQHYGLSVAEYKVRNLLKREVASRDVANLAAELCGPLFAKTTGAQIPVDGGNERVV